MGPDTAPPIGTGWKTPPIVMSLRSVSPSSLVTAPRCKTTPSEMFSSIFLESWALTFQRRPISNTATVTATKLRDGRPGLHDNKSAHTANLQSFKPSLNKPPYSNFTAYAAVIFTPFSSRRKLPECIKQHSYRAADIQRR